MTVQTRRFRRARTRNLPTYLFVAHVDDLDDVQLTCQTLPICAHGRLFIVAPDGMPNVAVPPRLSVTVLPSYDSAERAVDAWMTEMMTGVFAWFTDNTHEVGERIARRHELVNVRYGAGLGGL
ncbi:MAG: hypothetical protein ACTJFR_04275 [Canibacter sp.]